MISSDPMLILLRRALLAIGVLALLAGITGAWWRNDTEQHGLLLQGTVDSLLGDPDRVAPNTGSVTPVVTVTMPDSTTRTFHNRFAVPTGTILRGQRVLVRYRAGWRDILYVEGSATSPLFVLAMGTGIGLLFLGLARWVVPWLERRTVER